MFPPYCIVRKLRPPGRGAPLVFPTLFFPHLPLQLLPRSPEQVDGTSLRTSSEVPKLSILQRDRLG